MKQIVCVVSAWLLASPAHAYLLDLNDARVVAPGTMELELSPVGSLHALVGDESHHLIAPSTQIYLGLAESWDALYLRRGYIPLRSEPDQSPYAVAEQMVALRRLLVHGSYNDEELTGPSLAVQMGVLLPGVEAETGLGASVALLFAWKVDAGTAHANVWFSYTQDETYAVFSSLGYEGPSEWSVRPTAELYVDVDDGQPYVSGLVGVVGDVTDELSLQCGARLGGGEGLLELEIRISSWVYWELTPQS